MSEATVRRPLLVGLLDKARAVLGKGKSADSAGPLPVRDFVNVTSSQPSKVMGFDQPLVWLTLALLASAAVVATPLAAQTVAPPAALVVDGAKVTTDAKDLAKVSVTGEVLEPTKGPKIRIHKFKNKTGYHKRQGHRQQLTVLKVTGIK